jgi:hypothetical protein
MEKFVLGSKVGADGHGRKAHNLGGGGRQEVGCGDHDHV